MTTNFRRFKMSKFAISCVSFLTVLATSQISFSESHEHPIFKQLDNVKIFMRQKQLCGSFFQKDDLRKHFQECMGELSSKGEASSSSESAEVVVKDGPLKKAKTFISSQSSLFLTGKVGDGMFRTKREAISGNLMNQQHGQYWKLFENPHVFKNPCLISCVLEKFEMINSTGHSQHEKIQARAEELLSSANKTDFSSVASNITSTCVGERNAQEQSLESTVTESDSGNHDVNSDGMTKAKCRSVILFGKCLALKIFEACDEGVRFNLTSTTIRNTTEKHPL